MSKLWGGRFGKETAQLVRRFNDSIDFDRRLWQQDIRGSIAWAQALQRANVLSADEVGQITRGLHAVAAEWEQGQMQLLPGDEDIHTANERRLTEIVGDAGAKLHTGRSRNDQVATDFRLWTLTAVDELCAQLRELQQAIISEAKKAHALPLPGYTHLQHAQPVTWGHWLMSHFWPLQRDWKRLRQTRDLADECPLGCAALAGTAFAIDREWLARELGFSRISYNSLDAVSNRDFAVDFLYCCAMIGVHLSRLSEQLILFSSQEFGFVRIDDAYSTGSSLMPQKKNPDTLELTRGKAGRLIGRLVALLVTLKGLPSTYDKDLQEDKEGVFDAFDTLSIALPVMSGLLTTLQLQPQRMQAQLEAGLLATDLADYLVKKGVPFRHAHHIVGEVVNTAEQQQVALDVLPLQTLQQISDVFADDVHGVLNVEASLAARNRLGGTAPEAVLTQIAHAERLLAG